MRKDIETYELIEQYLNRILTGEDLIRVEKLIDSDKEFANEVHQHKIINDFVFDRSMVDIKEQIKTIHYSNLPTSGKKFGKGKLFGFLGAIILTGIIISSILFFDNKEKAGLIIDNETPVELNKPTIPEPKVVIQDEQPTQKISAPIKSEQTKESDYSEPEKINSEKQPANENPREEIIFIDKFQPIEEEENVADITSKEEIISKIPKEDEIINPQVNEINCQDITIEAVIESSKSCDNKASGQINISKNNITGGTPPYQVSIDGGQNFYSQFQFNKLLSKLYPVIIRDKDNCKSEKQNIIVGSKDCSYEYAFAPDKNEEWKIPTKEKTGNLKIYSKTGQIIYQETFDFPGEYYWNGRSSSGNELPMGAYMFILELQGEEDFYGTVTLVR